MTLFEFFEEINASLDISIVPVLDNHNLIRWKCIIKDVLVPTEKRPAVFIVDTPSSGFVTYGSTADIAFSHAVLLIGGYELLVIRKARLEENYYILIDITA